MLRPAASPGPLVAAGLLAAGPVVLAFFSGAYFDGPRTAAVVGVGLVLALIAVTAPRDALTLRTAGARAALAGFVLLAAWVAVSRRWSSQPEVAGADAERVVLYAGWVMAGAVVWRPRRLARLAEPAVAAGIVVVVLYGLAGRWLPGVVALDATASAGGRLEQPLTYWNATGLLAAVGAVLCVRIAGDGERLPLSRMVAAAAWVPLVCGVYLSFSRGALAALVAALVVLVLCAPSRRQARAVLVGLGTGVVAVVASGVLPGVRALEGSERAREREGLIALGVTIAAMAAAAALTARATRIQPHPARRDAFRVTPAARWITVALIVAGVVGPVLLSRERSTPAPEFGANSQRFASVQSNRYAYWRVAVDTFRHHPVAGVGSGGWGTEWLRERRIAESARDAHSIELETLAELGLVGFAALLLAFGGILRSAVDVQRRDPVLAAGACAALTAWLAHATIDWDWEMPGATLPVLTLAAMLLARAETLEPSGAVPAPSAISSLQTETVR